ncbi:MAG: ATP-binding cassette domain-containing protein [Candidatus Cloacimonas sp.]|jgi:ABC-type multidrug transport system ATPase subunit|nr:ATP-binding cassette domain-containing protein [Candidatus Cloacimonadota bacterium]
MLTLKNISFRHKEQTVLDSINYHFEPNKTYTITGGLSSGKSTLLKITGGLIPPTEGIVCFRERDIQTKGLEREIHRKIGYVFQEGVLISNLSVEENIGLPVKYLLPNSNRDEQRIRVKEMLSRFRVDSSYLDKRPCSIPASIRKTVNFAIAFILQPEVLMVDDPLFNLNKPEREAVIRELTNFKRSGGTMILTGNSERIIKDLTDEVIYLNEGKIQYSDKPELFFTSTDSELSQFVTEEIGD